MVFALIRCAVSNILKAAAKAKSCKEEESWTKDPSLYQSKYYSILFKPISLAHCNKTNNSKSCSMYFIQGLAK